MRIFTTLFLVALTVGLYAQQQQYSFISDKKFKGTDELIGYKFIPVTLVYPDRKNPDDSEEVPLNAGDITFLATQSYLIVEADQYAEYKGAYSINSINPTGYGFKLDLMNARNPSIQGHLKMVLNNRGQVDAYIFKPAPKVKEVMFYQAKIPQKLAEQEEEYFTDRGEKIIDDTTLWGARIYPFFELAQKQRRLLRRDSLNISFQTDTIITNKKKNKKKVLYSIVIQYNQMENGITKIQKETYAIGKVNERESRDAREKDSRFRLEFSIKKSKSKKIFMFLDENRAVSGVQVGQTHYTFR